MATLPIPAAGLALSGAAVDSWLSIAEEQISDDGRFAAYKVLAGDEPASLELVSTDGRWRKSLPAAVFAEFICEPERRCRQLVFQDAYGTLGVANLGSSSVERLGNVDFYRSPSARGRHRLAYRLTGEPSRLRLRNLWTRQEVLYEDVADAQFSAGGDVLLLKTKARTGGPDAQGLLWVDIATGVSVDIWQGVGLESAVFDATGTRLGFTVREQGEPQRRSVWHYAAGDTKAVRVTDESSFGLDPALRLDAIREFSADGRGLRVDLVAAPSSDQIREHAVDVDIWSYRDERLQSQQLADLAAGRPARRYAALVDIGTRTVTRLEQPGDKLGDTAWNAQVGEVALVDRRRGAPDRGEYHWNSAAELSIDLLHFRDGRRVRISTWDAPDESRPQLSPAGRFVVYFDPQARTFMSRDVATGTIRDITAGVSTDWRRLDVRWLPLSSSPLRGVAGWLENDASVLIYDQHDIWLLDLQGKAAPVNLTRGYGRQHQMIFTLRAQVPPRQRVFARNERLILAAFDQVSKQSGFFVTHLEGKAALRKLTMGAYAYYRPDEETGMPLKARHASTYLVRRSSATESPNLFATRDFLALERLSDLRPEKKYNWLTAELRSWRQRDGTVAQGILYRPQDFDPARRYPVIFTYYEVATDGLNSYLSPRRLAGGCEIDIPSYVSRGYVVVKPDIYYEPGKLRDSAVNAVVAAAEYMKTMPWVDAGRMGIQGCSFGGIATNSIVTSTGLFAAAVSASGIADLVSAYGSLWLPNDRAGASGGASLQRMPEIGQERMNQHLWKTPGLYVENSAILRADQVSTPLLLMHTRDDAVCPFSNAIEFFTALRRLGKRAWMLQYNEGNHQLAGAPARDFATRMAQFFDHYLMGAPAPKWMTRGVPARLKGVDWELDLDAPEVAPGPGLYSPHLERAQDALRDVVAN